MLGENTIFSWKSKKAQADEAVQYEQWAFPHGEPHRKKLEALLSELFPKETVATALIPFLTCRELYESVLKTHFNEPACIDHMINVQQKYKQIIRKKEMPLYLALVLAEQRIDERLEYPPAADIRARAEELEALRSDK